MAKLKWYLDTRSVKNDEAPIKLRISQKDGNAFISVGLRASANQWNDELGVVVNLPKLATMNRM